MSEDARVEIVPLEVGRDLKPAEATVAQEVVFDIDDLAVHYGKNTAFSGVGLDIYKHRITAVIGPSGVSKRTTMSSATSMASFDTAGGDIGN